MDECLNYERDCVLILNDFDCCGLLQRVNAGVMHSKNRILQFLILFQWSDVYSEVLQTVYVDMTRMSLGLFVAAEFGYDSPCQRRRTYPQTFPSSTIRSLYLMTSQLRFRTHRSKQ